MRVDAAKVNQVHLGIAQEDHEETAIERHGKGFVRSGPDDAEDGHDAERASEDGSEDEPYGWRFHSPDAGGACCGRCGGGASCLSAALSSPA